MDIRDLGSETEYYSLKCYIELNGVEYFQEWSIYLMFEGTELILIVGSLFSKDI